MLFSSIEFIYLFLPAVFSSYYLCVKFDKFYASRWVLILFSLFFYGYYNLSFVPIMLFSVIVNYIFGKLILNSRELGKCKYFLFFGVIFNIFLLGYFKYTNFLIDNINLVFGQNIVVQDIVLPLAISFFTFQQISYLMDSKDGLTSNYSFSNYILFVCFFPQLIAGPIVHHSQMMPQFKEKKNLRVNYRNILIGILIFFIGLFKKVALADYFSKIVNRGYGAETLSIMDGWYTSIGYSFQLYFDFSGYCDMAIGIALLFNIRLPINFDSPYKSRNIQDFWRRWHVTLGIFIRDYIYIKLGGNEKGSIRLYFNLVLTFLIAGIWHGAGWMFVIWGLLHGLALAVHRAFLKLDFKINKYFAIFLTFMFVNITWVIFRSSDIYEALKIFSAMFGISSSYFGSVGKYNMLYFVTFLVILLAPNSLRLLKGNFKVNIYNFSFFVLLFIYSLKIMFTKNYQEFIYFNF